MYQSKISDFGEKKLIELFIKPLFNPEKDSLGIGDDCTFVSHNENEVILLSTDRVPADLISFKLGLIDYFGLGNYLAQLNLSDIAACGGKPIGLLLNLGLPHSLLIEDFKKLLLGVKNVIEKYDCKVLGGDITSSTEISISATSIGKAKKGTQLVRSNAKEGDLIFVSRPIGITPTAFEYFCNLRPKGFLLPNSDEEFLKKQFTDMNPMCKLGQELASSGLCTSCMDNTDGIGQSLFEISELSGISMVIESNKVIFNDLTIIICTKTNQQLFEFAFGAGADFSLIGTLSNKYSEVEYKKKFENISIVGKVKEGKGVYLNINGNISKLDFKGWNYFLE